MRKARYRIFAWILAVSLLPGGFSPQMTAAAEQKAASLMLLSEDMFQETEEVDGMVDVRKSVITDVRPQAVRSEITVDGITFVHPGIYVSLEDLDTMQEMVRKGQEPWASAFDSFRSATRASKDYINKNQDRSVYCFYTGQTRPERYDSDAAYAQVIMWYITGDDVYRENALDIIRSYNESLKPEEFAKNQVGDNGVGGYGWSAEIISTGIAISKFTFVAELLRATPGSGWTEQDTAAFEQVLAMSFSMYDRVDKWMNQTGYTLMGLTASAVFQNDAGMYREAMERVTVNAKAKSPWADCSIARQLRLLEEYYDRETETMVPIPEEERIVQLVEMGRDQPHAGINVSVFSFIAQTARVQGTKVNEDGKIVYQQGDTWVYDDYDIKYEGARLWRYEEGDELREGKNIGDVIAVLKQEAVVSETEGTGLFEFLDNRILQGANYISRYNLGYEVPWYPVRSDYTNTPDDSPSAQYYDRPSASGRGAAIELMFTIYYYYKYELGYEDTDPDFWYVSQAFHYTKVSAANQDFIHEADLLIAPREAAYGEPKGEPEELVVNDYAGNTRDFGRTQIFAYTGKGGNSGLLVDYEDDLGIRLTTDSVRSGGYFWFKDYDFGTEGADRLILTSASNSSQGAKMQLILLDDVEVADWEHLTNAELTRGTIIKEFYSGPTGWWTTFRTVVIDLGQKLSGTHSFALRVLDSDNVYNLTANIDWFCFANSYWFAENKAIDAQFLSADAVKTDSAVTLTNGEGFGFHQMDLDRGISGLQLTALAEEEGTLLLYSADAAGEKQELIAAYALGKTGGTVRTQTLIPDEEGKTLTGIQNLYLEYQGNGSIQVVSVQGYVHRIEEEIIIPPLEAEDYQTSLEAGSVEVKTEGDITYTAQKAGSTLAYLGCATGVEQLKVRVRTDGAGGSLELRSEFGSQSGPKPFLTISLPDTKGEWRSLMYQLKELGVDMSATMFVTTVGIDVDVDYYAYSFSNTAPVLTGLALNDSVYPAGPEEGGIDTDYMLVGAEYRGTVQALDAEEDAVAVSADGPEGMNVQDGMVTWVPDTAGEYRYHIRLTDEEFLTDIVRRVRVFASPKELIAALLARYETGGRYRKATFEHYQEKLAAAETLAAAGEVTAELVTALRELEEAAAGLESLDRYLMLEDGSRVIDFESISTLITANGADGAKEYRKLLDQDTATASVLRSAKGNDGWLAFDMGSGFGVRISAIRLLGRQTAASERAAGARLQGSNDGVSWTDVTEAAVNTTEWQELKVISEETFRYIRIANPSNANWYGNLAELRIFGTYEEMDIINDVPKEPAASEDKSNTGNFRAAAGVLAVLAIAAAVTGFLLYRKKKGADEDDRQK